MLRCRLNFNLEQQKKAYLRKSFTAFYGRQIFRDLCFLNFYFLNSYIHILVPDWNIYTVNNVSVLPKESFPAIYLHNGVFGDLEYSDYFLNVLKVKVVGKST